MDGSPAYSFDLADLKEIGLALAALVGAVVLCFFVEIATQVNFGSYSVLVVLVVTPLLHAGIKYIKSNDTNLPDKDLIDALPGKTGLPE